MKSLFNLQLGMGEMLSQEKANFRGLSYDGNVYLQKIFQKAYIEVHEKGTVAAAATSKYKFPKEHINFWSLQWLFKLIAGRSSLFF